MSEDVCTLSELYERFAKGCIPEDAPSYQRREMKRAFYTGASVMMLEILGLNELEDRQAQERFDALDKEIGDFADELRIEVLLHAAVIHHFEGQSS